ncbi:MAG: S8 family serine peptidase, partial [Bacteroidales bacterium]
VWCSFPSSDLGYAPFHHPEPLTNGIYTTDRVGEQGYNPFGDYTDDFGGTSSSCPGAAGTVALMLSANPDLTWKQVREIIKDTCEKIDKAGGKYDSRGHSKYYGYGKVSAENAVKKALELKVTGFSKEKRNNRHAFAGKRGTTAKIKIVKPRKETV